MVHVHVCTLVMPNNMCMYNEFGTGSLLKMHL